jgi:hypothetical protein
LASGPRKSEYFVKLFQNAAAGNCTEAKGNLCRIQLDSLVAVAFPILLDYIYAPWEELKIETDVATALHHLGEYFDIHCLRWNCMEFDCRQFPHQHEDDDNPESDIICHCTVGLLEVNTWNLRISTCHKSGTETSIPLDFKYLLF